MEAVQLSCVARKAALAVCWLAVTIPAQSHADLDPVISEALQIQSGAHNRGLNTRGLTVHRDAFALDRFYRLAERAAALDADMLLTYRQDDQLIGLLLSFINAEPKLEVKYTIGTTQDIAVLTDRLRWALGVPQLQDSRAPRKRGLKRVDLPPDHSADWMQLSSDLGAHLFPAPAAAQLATVHHLMVVPTGILSTIPLTLLRPMGWSNLLADQLSISILPSAAENSTEVPPWTGTRNKRALILGNPDLHGFKDWDFPDLPGADREARAVHKSLRGSMYLGHRATADIFTQLGPRSNILYLATHAVADQENALDAGFIALAGKLITPREIQSMSFPQGSLVVLSACQTGLGGTVDGGMIGLARAFQIAGFQGVIMSLWSVEDVATYHLMNRFLFNLRKEAPQDALRSAMLEQRVETAKPLQWAPFVYFGTPMVANQSDTRH